MSYRILVAIVVCTNVVVVPFGAILFLLSVAEDEYPREPRGKSLVCESTDVARLDHGGG